MIEVIGATAKPIRVSLFRPHERTRDSHKFLCVLKTIYIGSAGKLYPIYWCLLETARFGEKLIFLTEEYQFILQWRWPFVSMCRTTQDSE